MKTAKKLLSMLLAVLMIVSIIPMSSITVSAAYENTYTNTGNQRVDIIGVAKTQIGYVEGSNNDTKYGDWYGLPNQAWCAMFVSWCANQAGIPTSVLKKTARAHPDNFGIPYYDGKSYTPKSGDLFFEKDFSHVGLVYYIEGDYFYTIEGNWSNKVCSVKKKISEHYFGVPNFISVNVNANTYTVYYNANGGTGAPSSQTKTYGKTLTLSSTIPTRTGYTFLGWSTSSTATTATYSAGATFAVDSSVTLYAIWKPNTYTVVYNGNGSTSGSTVSSSHTYNSLIPTSNIYYTAYEFMQTGHDFGPIIDKYGTGKYLIEFDLYADVAGPMRVYMQNGSTSKYAFWKDFDATTSYKHYSFIVDVSLQDSSVSQSMLAFYGGYGTGRNPHVKNVVFTKADENLTANGFTRTGYSFLGWSTSANATTATYTDKQSVKNLTSVNGGTVTLYAVWKPNTYTVVYNGNGSTGGSTASSSHQYNSLITSSGVYYKAYEFMQTGHDLAPVIDKHGTGKYLIEFDLYADVAGPMRVYMQNGSNSKYDWGEKTFDVTTNWKHYSFVVDVTLKDSSEVQSMLAFYGIYNTGRNPHVKNVVFTKADENLTANGFTRTGYSFLGWSTSANATTATYTDKQSVKNLTSVNGGTVTLYAVWKPNTYTVKFNANGGTGTMSNQTYTYGYVQSLSANSFTKQGYSFIGWSTNPNTTSAEFSDMMLVQNLTSTNGGTVTLYAVWKANTYTVSYNANGGTNAPSSQTKTYGKTLTLSSAIPTRTGYTFLGWSTSSTATSAIYSAGDSFTTNANTTLYAVWKANTYTVSYNANGGTGAPSSQTKTYGKALTLSSTIPTKTGYTFLGWSTSSTATSAIYSAGDSFTANANTTLYAVWKANTYTISYNANGGTGAPASQTKTHGTALTLSTTKPTRTGYTFLGWSTSSTATSATYSAGDSFTTNANTTLYAVWKKAGHDINNDGIVNSNDTGLYKYNGTWYYVKNGDIDYTFTGLTKHTNGIWYYVENGVLDWSHTGLVKHTNGVWYYVQKSQLNWSKTGLVKHTNGVWYYVQRGQLNWNYTGLVKHTNGIWYYVQKGQLNWNYTGLVKHTDGNWYYVQKGQINWNYTGLVKHTNGKWYYVQKGKLNWNYTGYAYYNGKKYKVVKGEKV